jgi:nucleotide-binding universal stress UspA family protein
LSLSGAYLSRSAQVAIFQSFVVQIAMPLRRWARKNSEQDSGCFSGIPAQEMHTIRQSLLSQRFLSRRGSVHMKAQVMEPEEVLEFVPQVLDLKKILVPIDFSPMSKKAFQYAVRFAEQFGCEIVLLHVVEPVRAIAGAPLAVDIFAQPEEDMIAAKEELGSLVASSRNDSNCFTSAVRTGHAPNEITKAAKDLDVDLILIATHGYTSWRHLCIGSTAERVVRTAPCPVLVVREKEHDFI